MDWWTGEGVDPSRSFRPRVIEKYLLQSNPLTGFVAAPALQCSWFTSGRPSLTLLCSTRVLLLGPHVPLLLILNRKFDHQVIG